MRETACDTLIVVSGLLLLVAKLWQHLTGWTVVVDAVVGGADCGCGLGVVVTASGVVGGVVGGGGGEAGGRAEVGIATG